MTFDFTPHSLGWYYESDRYLVFFGNRNANLDQLKLAFPSYQFVRAKQVHGYEIGRAHLPTDDLQVEADGVLTREKRLAVCSITADCVPVLVTSPAAHFVLALHAGWRGVALRIVPKGIQQLVKEFSPANQLQVFIGPHIQSSSFEVKADALELLAKASRLPAPSIIVKSMADSFWVDLKSILLSQLDECAVGRDNVSSLDIDTYTTHDLHSHRRDREKAGRQISFAVLK